MPTKTSTSEMEVPVGPNPPPRVLLVQAPMGALDRPALGLSLLRAAAAANGVPCDVRYLTFAFADLVGAEDYDWLAAGPPYEALVGEWLFAEALFGPRAGADAGYVSDVLVGRHGWDAATVARLDRGRRCATHFVESCRSLVPWGDYDVVGFTSTFQQNVASLALAQSIRADHPDVQIVFGGANWEGAMGRALMERFDFVDAACQGEADESFPRLLEAIRTGSTAAIDGVVRRVDGALVTGPARPVHDLDALPLPDFDAYFEALTTSASGLAVLPRLLVETARGCWWGAHSHCTFCGLNGASMGFRSKSPERALGEIRELHARHGIPTVSVVDNILDMRYVRTVLPELEREGPALDLFWEVKANLSQAQVRQLAAAGVRHVQPGIESMSDHVLDLLRKGTTMLRNVQLLKWGVEHGVRIEWNLLFGAPGETPEDYAEMAALFPLLVHLDPPGACGPIRLDRFSPYHADPGAFGMVNVRAMVPYRWIYDVDAEQLDQLAYYFDFDYADAHDPLTYVGPALAAVEHWRIAHGSAALWMVERTDGELAIVDDRGPRRRTGVIGGWRAAVYRAIDRAHDLDELEHLPELDGVDPDELVAFLGRSVHAGVAVSDGARWLGLAVASPARPAAAPARRRLELVAADA